MPISKIKQGSIGQSAVTSDNILDGTIVNADISPSAAIADAKVPGIGTLNTSVSSLCTTATSISRDGGSNYTTATLTDSGYVTGSSGQRILTGQATISGQPSGQSMRWKLALANNAVKIHGVSLQWS